MNFNEYNHLAIQNTTLTHKRPVGPHSHILTNQKMSSQINQPPIADIAEIKSIYSDSQA